jgi:pentatricopeptide repeat protein
MLRIDRPDKSNKRGQRGHHARAPRERLDEMLAAVAHSPATPNRTVANVLLTACAREAARAGDNSAVKREFFLGTALMLWCALVGNGTRFDAGSAVSKPSTTTGRSAPASSYAGKIAFPFVQPDYVTVSLLYRIFGECRAPDEARDIRRWEERVLHPRLSSFPPTGARCHYRPQRGQYWEKRPNDPSGDAALAAAAYLLCLGKCGRSTEAEAIYLSDERLVPLRRDPHVLGGLFQAHVASDRISKAEALIAQHGADFLNVQSCNAFVNRCSSLRLRDKAVAFVNRMRTGAHFPRPDSHTYNLLIKTLCATSGAEDASVAVDRALLVIDHMRHINISPTTVTYNLLIRNLAYQRRIDEAIRLYRAMSSFSAPPSLPAGGDASRFDSGGDGNNFVRQVKVTARPDHLTFSNLMIGAAAVGDLELARSLQRDLDATPGVYPNYSFCKKLLEVIARVDGVEAAFTAAKDMSVRYADALQVFGDVGGREAVRMALIFACGAVGDLPRAFAALRLDLAGSDANVGQLAPLYIATGLMQVCLDCSAQGQALEVFHSIKRAGLDPNFEVYEKLIHGLVSLRGGGGLVTVPSMRSCNLGDHRYDDEHLIDGISGISGEESYVDRPGEQGQLVVVDINRQGRQGGSMESDDWGSWGMLDNGDGTINDNSEKSDDSDGLVRRSRAPNALEIAVSLLGEMHAVGAARTARNACYVYNTLIAAAARLDNLDLACQLFIKMCRHNNPGVVYFASPPASPNGIIPSTGTVHSSMRYNRLVSLGIFESSFEFPAATPSTYNSMMHAARICGRPELSFAVYDAMQADRMNEPGQATLALLADISLESAQQVGVGPIQRLLKNLDGISIVTPELRFKRNSLRKFILTLRWSHRERSPRGVGNHNTPNEV